eukprot:12366288-Prorocentrum_lima.AAC.1
MGVGGRRRRELRRNKEEVVLEEKVGKEMPMHGGAGLSVGFMLSHQARVVGAGEPAVGINAEEEAGSQEGPEISEEGGIIP